MDRGGLHDVSLRVRTGLSTGTRVHDVPGVCVLPFADKERLIARGGEAEVGGVVKRGYY